MYVLTWMILGLIIGLSLGTIDQKKEGVIDLGTTFLSVAGAVIGGYVAKFLFESNLSGYIITSYLISIGGSLFLLSLGKMFVKNN